MRIDVEHRRIRHRRHCSRSAIFRRGIDSVHPHAGADKRWQPRAGFAHRSIIIAGNRARWRKEDFILLFDMRYRRRRHSFAIPTVAASAHAQDCCFDEQ